MRLQLSYRTWSSLTSECTTRQILTSILRKTRYTYSASSNSTTPLRLAASLILAVTVSFRHSQRALSPGQTNIHAMGVVSSTLDPLLKRKVASHLIPPLLSGELCPNISVTLIFSKLFLSIYSCGL